MVLGSELQSWSCVPCEISCKWPVVLLWYYSGAIFGPAGLYSDLKLQKYFDVVSLNGEHIHTSIYTLVWLLSLPLPPATSCRREGPFPVNFHLQHEHLFPTSCF